jgi:hypothetical protein
MRSPVRWLPTWRWSTPRVLRAPAMPSVGAGHPESPIGRDSVIGPDSDDGMSTAEYAKTCLCTLWHGHSTRENPPFHDHLTVCVAVGIAPRPTGC